MQRYPSKILNSEMWKAETSLITKSRSYIYDNFLFWIV